MDIQELFEFTKAELKSMRDAFQYFQTNDFKHLEGMVVWIFFLMLFVSVTTIGTLIAVLL